MTLPIFIAHWTEHLEARKDELAAIEAGEWPRDINDSMRWNATGTSEYLSAAENQRIRREHAEKMCRSEIDYYEGKLREA